MHLIKKKNLRAKGLVACFERGWWESKARLNEIRRYTSFMGRVSNGRTACKGSSGIFLSKWLKNEDEKCWLDASSDQAGIQQLGLGF